MVEDQDIIAAISRARRLAEEEPEPFKSLAFTAVLQFLLATPASGTGTTEAETRAAPPPQVSEFLAGVQRDSHMDTVEAILYHALHGAGTDRMNSAELTAAYGRARLKKPSNLSDVLRACIQRGHVIPADEPKGGQKAWQITARGEAYIQGRILESQ